MNTDQTVSLHAAETAVHRAFDRGERILATLHAIMLGGLSEKNEQALLDAAENVQTDRVQSILELRRAGTEGQRRHDR